MESLRELYADQNSLEMLPETLTECKRLEQVDFSENNISVLPTNIGELRDLTDVVLSQNSLTYLPDSIGDLRKLTILKADENRLEILTHNIGRCENLAELLLTANQLMVISLLFFLKISRLGTAGNDWLSPPADESQSRQQPVDVGPQGDRRLRVPVNPIAQGEQNHGIADGDWQVRETDGAGSGQQPAGLPPLHRQCTLQTTSPLALGEPGNGLLILFNGYFLQSQAMLKLQQTKDPRTNVKVLTCYLLPQRDSQGIGRLSPSDGITRDNCRPRLRETESRVPGRTQGSFS